MVTGSMTEQEEGALEAGWNRGMVRIESRGPIALITLDRAEKLNAMDRAFWPDLRAGLEWVVGQEGLRAIILTGAGERAFSVGGDIGSFAALTTAEDRRAFQIDAMATFAAVEDCPLTIIAAINGLALGGGCEIAMACDFVVAGRSAAFGLPEARFGLVPGYGVLRAPALIGEQLAKMMILAGERLSAEEALRCGLVQKLVADTDLMDEALRLAAAAATASPSAIAAGKKLMRKPIGAEAVACSVDTISALHATPESRAAVGRFLKS
jgi:enoyl-CoA hydratase